MPDSMRKTCPPQSGNPEWENYLRAWEKSGLSKAEYCRQKNISYHAFNYWKKRLRKPSSTSHITLVKLEETESVTSSFSKRPVTSQSPIRFWLNEFCIEVGNDFSAATLNQLLHTLRRL
jgi:hypothetical protein